MMPLYHEEYSVAIRAIWTMSQLEQRTFLIKIPFTKMKITCMLVQYNYCILYK